MATNTDAAPVGWTLTSEQREIVSRYPLTDEDRAYLQKALQPVVDGGIIATSHQVVKCLCVTRAVDELYRPSDRSPFIGHLKDIVYDKTATIPQEAWQRAFDAINTRATDEVLWTAIRQLIESYKQKASSRTTPPPTGRRGSGFPQAPDTPVQTNSSQADDSASRLVIEATLLEEIRHCTHRGVPGFFGKHFDIKRFSSELKAMFDTMLRSHDGKRWNDFPAVTNEPSIGKWLLDLAATALYKAPYTLQATTTANEFQGAKGQIAIFFYKSQARKKKQLEYKDIKVGGKYKQTSGTGDFQNSILQLSRYVRNIFAAQPLRRFVHGFTINGAMVELWVYDRSGPYSSGEFNVHDEPEKLASALVTYATMRDEARGECPLLNQPQDDGGWSVTLPIQGTDTTVALAQPFFSQAAIVCRGTACYTTQYGVLKFSWRSTKRQWSETRHLKQAAAYRVKGVAKLVAESEITSTAKMRTGLAFSRRTLYRFQDTGWGEPHSRSGAVDPMSGGIGPKRKAAMEPADDAASSKKTPVRRSKRLKARQLNNQTDAPAPNAGQPSTAEAEAEEFFDNRMLSCLIVRPKGCDITEFKSVEELLTAMRDAIKAHQSLYEDAKILDRHISAGNILIIDPKEADGRSGMLIDLDLAVGIDDTPSGTRCRAGTAQFIAIGVLQGHRHNYRHDLESFFYVLLWMCARNAWDEKKQLTNPKEERPPVTRLERWEMNDFEAMANAKRTDMTSGGLLRITQQFPAQLEAVGTMCKQIQRILFGSSQSLLVDEIPGRAPQYVYRAILQQIQNVLDEI